MPRLLISGLDLSLAVIFFSFVFWTWLFGLVGARLSVVLTALLKFMLEANDQTRGRNSDELTGETWQEKQNFDVEAKLANRHNLCIQSKQVVPDHWHKLSRKAIYL